MRNVNRISRKDYLKQFVTIFLVCCMFCNPAVLAEVVITGYEPGNPIDVTPLGTGTVQNITNDIGGAIGNGAIGYFSDFDIAQGHTVNCLQDIGSNALFKVDSTNTATPGTQIYGIFNSDGNIYLQDFSGIFIGPTGQINTNEFIASTLRIKNDDWVKFINGDINQLKFERGAGDPLSVMENQGLINASKVYLIGSQVLNSGTIKAGVNASDLLVMAAGDKVFLTHEGSKVLIKVPTDLVTPDPATNKVDIDAGSTINADQVVLAAGDVFTAALNVGSLAATANRDITLEDNVTTTGDITLIAGQNVDIAANKTVTTNGNLTIEATGGEIMAETSVIDMAADGQTLTLTQNANMDLEQDFSVDNRINTNLVADSTGGSVVSDAAGEWGSIAAHAADNITLSDISEVIKTGSLEADSGNVKVTSTDGKVEVYGPVSAGQDVSITATDEGLDGSENAIYLYGAAEGGKSIEAGRDILLKNNTWAASGYYLGAGQDVIVGDGTADGTTLSGEGALTVEADRDITLGGAVAVSQEISGDLILKADADTVNEEPDAVAGGDMTAYGTIDNPGGDIDIYAADSTIYLWDSVTALGDIILHNNTVVKAAGKTLESEEDDVVLAADKTLDSDYDLTINAGDDILLGVTNVDQHWIDQDIGSGGDVTANGGDLILNAGDDIYAHGSLTSTGGSDVDITAVYDARLYGPVTAQDNIYITVVSGDDEGTLIAYDSLTANTGEIDIFTDYYIDLRGPVYAYTDLTMNADTEYYDDGYIFAEDTLTAETGNILGTADDQIRFDDVAKAGGNITLDADSDDIVYVNDDLTVNGLVAGGYIDLSAGDYTIYINKSADLSATADVDAGSDIILHANTEVADGVKLDAGQDIHLDDHKTLNGVGTFTLEANRDIYLGGDTTAGTGGTGSLYLTSDADDTDGGIVEAKGNIVAADDVTISGNVLLTGADGVATHTNQKIEATTGKLTAEGSVKKTTTGELDIFGGFDGPLGSGDYSVSTKEVSSQEGDLTIAGNAFVLLDGDIYSKGRMELTSNADGDEIGVDAGTLEHASGTIKSLNDDVDMAAINSRILLNGGVAYDPANPSTTTYVSAGGDILLYSSTSIAPDRNLDAGDDVALAANKRIVSDGSLTIEAGDDILLGIDDVTNHWLNQEIGSGGDVTVNGDLTLAAIDDIYAHGQLMTETDSGGNMTLSGVDVTVYGDVESDGILDVTADDDVMLKANVSSVGAMTMVAGSDIELNSSSGDTSSEGTITLSAGDEVIIGEPSTGGGNVTADGHIGIHAGDDWNDDVKVYGKLTTLADSGGNIDVTAGDDITIWGTDNGSVYESVEADGALTMSSNTSGEGFLGGDLYIAGDTIAESMQLEAGAGGPPDYSPSHVRVDGSLQTTGGDMIIRAHHDVLLGGNVDSAGNLVLNADRHGDYGYPEPHVYGGDVEVEGTIVANGTIDMYGNNITLWDTVTSTGDMTITADTSPDYDYQTGDPVGDVFAHGMLTSTEGSIEISASDDTIYLGDDVKAYVDVTLNNNTEFFSNDDQKVDAQTGMITANGWLWKDSDWGSLYLEAAGDISLADYVGAYYGGVSIISEEGKIFTPDECGYETDTLNVYVYGWSDDYYGDGVDLPYPEDDPVGKAAIIIMSAKDLKLGPGAGLVAEGYYDNTTVDDRKGVDFLDVPLTAIGDVLRDEGDPIDVAVYLASKTGDVDVESQEVYVESPGTMVVDAYDTVRLGDMTSEPAIQTVESIEVPDGRFWSINRLEVASRITEWLFEASIYGTLPHPYNPEIVESFIGGDYVLRGAGLGNPVITDGRAWVLEDPLDPAPLYREAGQESEDKEFAEGGCTALMNWLATEIGVPADDIQVVVADALALNTDVQPCEMCARLMEASKTLEDAEGTQIAALARVVNEFVTTPAPPSPEQMTQIAAALAEHAGDGTYYAAAGKWIDALVAYIGIMSTEMGYSASDAAAFAQKYLAPVTETGDAALTAYVQSRLAALGG